MGMTVRTSPTARALARSASHARAVWVFSPARTSWRQARALNGSSTSPWTTSTAVTASTARAQTAPPPHPAADATSARPGGLKVRSASTTRSAPVATNPQARRGRA
jgi:hypothetical protein